MTLRGHSAPGHATIGHLDGRRSVRRLDVDSDTIGTTVTIDIPREPESAE